MSLVTSMGAEIVDSGSNENGDYIKFSDGNAICMKKGTIQTKIWLNSSGVIKRSSNLQIGKMPIELKQISYYNTDGNMVYIDEPTMGWIQMNDVATITDFAPIVAFSPFVSENRTIYYSAIVIGKWKLNS